MRFIDEHEAHRARDAKGEAHDPNFTVDTGSPRVKNNQALTSDQKRLVESMPKKVAAYLMTLWRKGVPERVRECARRGQNPFDCGRFRPAKVAYDMIVNGGFTKQSLRVAYQDSLGWTENAAFSQVSIIWRVFQALEIGAEEGELLVPHPMLGAQNVCLN